MAITTGLLNWFRSCEIIEEPEYIDVNQLPAEMQALGVYKQPSRTIDRLIDGTQIITDVYYLLFQRPAQMNDERISNEEYLEQVETWVENQEYAENYPDIGYPVFEIEVTNTFCMLNRTETEAVYQLAISVKYEKGLKK